MKKLPIAVAAAALLLATTACGSPQSKAAATDQPDTTQQTEQQPDQQLARDFPGASGKVAAISGRTLQVQNPMSGQVAVTYTTATEFTAQAKATAADLEVGDCVMASGDDVAETVRISEPVAGECGGPRVQGGPGGLAGGPPADLPTDRPTDAPTGAPSGMRMSGVFGRVTAITATGFTVETTLPGQDDATTQEVSTSSKTTWTHMVAATAKGLKVGKCVVASGTKDDVGAVTAKTIAISDAVDGECTMGARRIEATQP